MSGIKGRSGGARLGTGRKPKASAVQIVDAQICAPPSPAAECLADASPLEYVLYVMRDSSQDVRIRLQAAAIALPYMHAKATDLTGKQQERAAARSAARGKFTPNQPPGWWCITRSDTPLSHFTKSQRDSSHQEHTS